MLPTFATWAMIMGLVAGPSESSPPSPPPVVPPEVVHAPEAERPSERTDETVEVLLRLDIDVDGRVTRAVVVESGGEVFDGAAVEVAQDFVFLPAQEGSTPIAVSIQYRYVFEPRPNPEATPAEEPAIDDTEVVRAPPVERHAVQSELSGAKAERMPGTQGDAIKAAQTLGGIARPSASTGELSIWGAAVADSRRYIDWMPVPRLFHLGGSRSIVPTPLVDAITVAPGGFGPAYGRAIGGNLHVRTRGARSLTDPRRVGGYARIDPIDAGAAVDARVHERGWFTAAVRRSLLQHTFGEVAPEAAQKVVPIPQYWDYQAKSVITISARDELQVLGLGAYDRVERGIASLTAEDSFSERRESGFHRVGARLRRLGVDGTTTTAAVWGGFDDERWAQQFAVVRASSRRRSAQGGLRVEQRRRLADFVVLRWGLDLEVGRHRSEQDGALTLPAREGDVVVFGQPPGDRVAQDAWTTVQAGAAAYSSLRFEWAQGRWAIEPGLRLEPMVVAGDRLFPVRPVEPEVGYTDVSVAVDPRLSLRWAPITPLAFFAAGGRYHQAPNPADLSPVFGNPRLRPAEAYHAVGGVEVNPARWLAMTLTGFFIRGQDLAGRSPDPTPSVAQLLVSETDARNYGGQLSARAQPTDSLFAMATYSLMRAERRDPGASSWRAFDFDQTHVLQALIGWSHRSGVHLGGRLSLSSGNPRTAVVDAVANTRTGGFDPIFGNHNDDRLPAYISASVRVGYRRAWQWGELSTWLDLQNVTHRKNAEEYFYSSDFSERGTVNGLPILPVVGIAVRR